MSSKILIVEDHQDSREILRLQIQALGYQVIEAASGEEALEKALAETPDLIIMDLGLPGMNGIEATRELKKSHKTTHIPVLAHTAWKEEDYKHRGEEAGMAGFLTKPTSPRVFKQVIQRLLPTKS
jgi:CheY-like chemotaxis protein